MNRGTLTIIEKLQVGDRFHRAGDQKKVVWTKVEHQTKVTNYQAYKHWAVKDGERYPQALKHNSPVVFLRHATESAVISGER